MLALESLSVKFNHGSVQSRVSYFVWRWQKEVPRPSRVEFLSYHERHLSKMTKAVISTLAGDRGGIKK